MAATIALIFLAIFAAMVWFLGKDIQSLVDGYQSNLRGNFFTGFLTIGSFLLSLKTFIVVKLKEGVYDSESYRKLFAERTGGRENVDIYEPLRNISSLLFGTILSAIITAILHVTLGLISHWVAVIICIFSVVFSIVLLLISLVLIRINIASWLNSENR